MGKKKPSGDKGKDGHDQTQGQGQSPLSQQRYSSRRGRKAAKKK